VTTDYRPQNYCVTLSSVIRYTLSGQESQDMRLCHTVYVPLTSHVYYHNEGISVYFIRHHDDSQ